MSSSNKCENYLATLQTCVYGFWVYSFMILGEFGKHLLTYTSFFYLFCKTL